MPIRRVVTGQKADGRSVFVSDELVEPTRERLAAEMRETRPGRVEVLEPDHPGMHTTHTVDFDLVVSGEVWLELDDGAEVHLRAGDGVVQNGTRHAWRNRSDQPCVIAVALVGAARTS